MAKQHVVLSLAISLAMNLAIAIGGFVLLEGTAIAQDYRGTQEQQMACTPDVFRLCGAQIPDADRIVACLRANVPQLSPGCRAVFDTGDPQQTARQRGRVPQSRPQYEAGPPLRQQFPLEDD